MLQTIDQKDSKDPPVILHTLAVSKSLNVKNMRTLSHHHKYTVKILTVTSCKLNCHDLFSCYAAWVFFFFSLAMAFFHFFSVFFYGVFTCLSVFFLLSFNLELYFPFLFSFNRLFSSFFHQNGSAY